MCVVRRKPGAFRNRLVEVSSVGEHLDCFQVSAASTRLFRRFNLAGLNIKANTGTGSHTRKIENSEVTEQVAVTGEFEDIASLMDACSPTTDSLKALVAGYWLQVCQGSQSFDGQSANKELKHLGHAVGNITRALGAVIDQKPALVL